MWDMKRSLFSLYDWRAFATHLPGQVGYRGHSPACNPDSMPHSTVRVPHSTYVCRTIRMPHSTVACWFTHTHNNGTQEQDTSTQEQPSTNHSLLGVASCAYQVSKKPVRRTTLGSHAEDVAHLPTARQCSADRLQFQLLHRREAAKDNGPVILQVLRVLGPVWRLDWHLNARRQREPARMQGCSLFRV